MKEKLIKKLHEIEVDKNIKILMAVQTGSRMWGYNKPDSDYDVRFIYMRPQRSYVSLFEENMTYNEIDKETGTDFSGMDIKKFLQLLCKSNFNCFEMISSTDILIDFEYLVYESSFHEFVTKNLKSSKLMYQSFGMLNQIMKKGITTDKEIIVAMREILLIENYIIYQYPSLNMDFLMCGCDDFDKKAIYCLTNMISVRKVGSENLVSIEDRDYLLWFINEQYNYYKNNIDHLTKMVDNKFNQNEPDVKKIDELLSGLVFLWE